VRLALTAQFYEDTLKGLDQFSQGKQPQTSDDSTEAALAVWWVPPKDVIQNPHTRQLQGEIHLSNELPPSSDFLPLRVRVSIDLLDLPITIC